MSALELDAGRLTAVLDDGQVRWLRVDGREVVRGIYVAVRDGEWRTIPGLLDALTVTTSRSGFEVQFHSAHRSGDVAFDWQATITAADGRLSFTMDGYTRSAFLTNRIGFCVLHPASLAGVPVRVLTTDGERVDGQFPTSVSPSSPFTDIESISWTTGPDRMQLDFEGDAFEMEDQRNWTDASYKTFCTPLHRPHPVPVAASQSIRQQVRFRVAPARPPAQPRRRSGAAHLVSVGPGVRSKALPAIGTSLVPGRPALSPQEVPRLDRLRLGFLRVVLEPEHASWTADWSNACKVAEQLAVPLEVELVTSKSKAGLGQFLDCLGEAGARVVRVLVFSNDNHTTPPAVSAWLTHQLVTRGLDVPLGGGSRANFAELNRSRLPAGLNYLTFPVSPQVHARDTHSIMENVEAQQAVAADARRLGRGVPLIVGPITLMPRFNPYGLSPPPLEADDEERTDLRQDHDFAAAWTFASIAQLSQSGVEHLVLHEATGPAGLVRGSGPSPLERALSLLADVRHGSLMRTKGPPEVSVLAVRTESVLRVLLINRTGRERRLDLRVLHARGHGEASSYSLPPFGWSYSDQELFDEAGAS